MSERIVPLEHCEHCGEYVSRACASALEASEQCGRGVGSPRHDRAPWGSGRGLPDGLPTHSDHGPLAARARRDAITLATVLG